MSQSLSNDFIDVITILENERQYDKLELLQNIDKQLLRDVINFFHPFTATVQCLETERIFHRFWPTLYCLVSICSVTLNDSKAHYDCKHHPTSQKKIR